MPAYKDNKTGKWFCKFYYTDWQGRYDFPKSLRTLYGGYDRPLEAVNHTDQEAYL